MFWEHAYEHTLGPHKSNNMQAVEADITGAFWDNTDGVGTGAAFVHVQGVVPPIEGVVSTTPGAMYPTPSATAVLCNGTNKPVTAKLLPWNETHVILASDEASRPRTVQSATKGGSLTLQGDQRPWIERMTSLLAAGPGRIEGMPNVALA